LFFSSAGEKLVQNAYCVSQRFGPASLFFSCEHLVLHEGVCFVDNFPKYPNGILYRVPVGYGAVVHGFSPAFAVI
jgi:hypothetical protein